MQVLFGELFVGGDNVRGWDSQDVEVPEVTSGGGGGKVGVTKNTSQLPLSSRIKILLQMDMFHQSRALKRNL